MTSPSVETLRDTVLDCVRTGGEVLRRHFGRVSGIRLKENQASVVTDADLESEREILGLIRSRFPDHNIVAEETGFTDCGSDYTWVVDPLDGTSNFAAGLPWFGVMVAVLERGRPLVGSMYLPLDDRIYFATRGGGAWRNGERVAVSTETDLSRMLCSIGLDPNNRPETLQEQAALLALIVQKARNIRATNSLVDFAFTIDGRLGACVNLNTKIWDIAAPMLILQEAGGLMTDLDGREIVFSRDADCVARSHAVAGGNPVLLRQILDLVPQSGLASA